MRKNAPGDNRREHSGFLSPGLGSRAGPYAGAWAAVLSVTLLNAEDARDIRELRLAIGTAHADLAGGIHASRCATARFVFR